MVDETKSYKNTFFPVSFLLAPGGKRNHDVLTSTQKGEVLDLVSKDKKYGEITVDEVFSIDKRKRAQQMYGTSDMSDPAIQKMLKRLGDYAVSGDYEVDFPAYKKAKQTIEKAKAKIGAKHLSAIVSAAKPLHRAHERIIRLALEKTDLLVIFLLKPYGNDILPFELRTKTLNYLIENFLPKNRIVVVPFEKTYLFSGSNEMLLDAIVAQNYGCDRLVIGQNHTGLGLFYERNRVRSVFDNLKGIDISVEMVNEFVYCSLCRMLVSLNSCPHGHHNHISYHSILIMELLKTGIIPPSVLMRKEISAMILSHLFPDRFKHLDRLYNEIMPVSGIVEEHNDEDFYIRLMNLYQTTPLT